MDFENQRVGDGALDSSWNVGNDNAAGSCNRPSIRETRGVYFLLLSQKSGPKPAFQ